MKCWHCNFEMIWGGDNDFSDFGMEGSGIVSNFSCSNCHCPATAEVILPLEENEETNS